MQRSSNDNGFVLPAPADTMLLSGNIGRLQKNMLNATVRPGKTDHPEISERSTAARPMLPA